MSNARNKVIYLITTSLCLRDNRQHDFNGIPYVTEKELSSAEAVYITGGEPVLFSDPNNIASYLKNRYKNIRKVYLCANVTETNMFLNRGGNLSHINGVVLSITQEYDQLLFSFVSRVIRDKFPEVKDNRIFVSDGLMPDDPVGFKVINQENFRPADGSILRKV